MAGEPRPHLFPHVLGSSIRFSHYNILKQHFSEDVELPCLMRVAFPWRLRLASCAGSLCCAGHAAFGWLVSGEAVVFSVAISIQNIRNSPLERLEQGDHIHFLGNLRRHKNETILNGDLGFPWDAPNVIFFYDTLKKPPINIKNKHYVIS